MDQEIYELPQTPEQRAQIAFDMAVQSAFNALDEIMAFGADPLTRNLVLNERIAMHQLASRTQLIASFIEASKDQPGKVRMVVNNGVR